MDNQDVVNTLFGFVFLIVGFLLRALWDALKDLRASDKDIVDRIAAIEVLVAGEYVKREEFERAMTRLFEKLDVIETGITGKVDRATCNRFKDTRDA